MWVFESPMMIKRKAKGEDHKRDRVCFFSEQKEPKKENAGDRKATGKPH